MCLYVLHFFTGIIQQTASNTQIEKLQFIYFKEYLKKWQKSLNKLFIANYSILWQWFPIFHNTRYLVLLR